MDQKALIKNISMIVGIAVVAFFGLFFILFGDLYLSATSPVLFLGILFPLLSVVFFILSESFKHKPVLFYLFKGIAIAAAIGFVVYIFHFMTTAGEYAVKENKGFESFLKNNPGKTSENFISTTKRVCVLIGVFSIIGVIGQAVNVVMNEIIGLD